MVVAGTGFGWFSAACWLLRCWFVWFWNVYFARYVVPRGASIGRGTTDGRTCGGNLKHLRRTSVRRGVRAREPANCEFWVRYFFDFLLLPT